jgi:hypothetical protein
MEVPKNIDDYTCEEAYILGFADGIDEANKTMYSELQRKIAEAKKRVI